MSGLIILGYFLFGAGMGIAQIEKKNTLDERLLVVFAFTLIWPIALGFYIGEKMKKKLEDR